MDDVGAGGGDFVVDFGRRGEEGFSAVGGCSEGVEGEDVAEVGVEGLGAGDVGGVGDGAVFGDVFDDGLDVDFEKCWLVLGFRGRKGRATYGSFGRHCLACLGSRRCNL